MNAGIYIDALVAAANFSHLSGEVPTEAASIAVPYSAALNGNQRLTFCGI
jgi:hypothetical protein